MGKVLIQKFGLHPFFEGKIQ